MTTTKKSTGPSANGVALTLDAVVKDTTPAERVVRLCVRGDLFAEHQRLNEQLDSMRERDMGQRRTGRLNQQEEGPPKAHVDLAKKIVKLEDEMEKHSVDFVFRRIPGDLWDQLMAAHPPREDNAGDGRMGINSKTFAAPAVQAACVSPEGFDNDEIFIPWWRNMLSDGQRDYLFYGGAWPVNREPGDVPKSLSASSVIRRSEQKSSSATE
jgi:hypothetical protein